MPQFKNNIDLGKFELQNAKIHVVASDPSSPQEGIIYYNSTDKVLKYYTGAAWIVLGRLDQTQAPTASVSLNSQKITNLLTPAADTDAATKGYVDSVVNGLDWKASVRAASTTAGTLATDFENGDTIDGVVLATGDRILIKDQADPEENGIYVVAASGAPARAGDANVSAEVTAGLAVFVSEGSTNGGTGWVLTTDDPITLGTTELTFVQFTGGATRASLGLDTTDNPQFAGINLGHASDTTLTRSSAGNVAVEGNALYRAGGTDVPVADGGTGASTAPAARTNLGATGKYSATIGDGVETAISITQVTHGLAADGTNIVATYDATTGARVYPDELVNPANGTCTFTFAVAPTSNQYRVVIIG